MNNTELERRIVISAAIDRIWDGKDAEQIRFRNRLFPEGKPSVLRFVFRMRVYLMWSVIKKIVKLFV